jgi:hypothetical protein
MLNFEFTVTFSVPGLDWDEDQISNKIFGSGLNDALVLLGLRGVIGLDITRSAPTAEEAIKSAISDIRGVFPEANLLEVKPDLVSIADIAKLVGQSRQNLRKLRGFPPPTLTGAKPYWHLFEVSRWYADQGKTPIPNTTVETSQAAWAQNLQLEQQRLEQLS